MTRLILTSLSLILTAPALADERIQLYNFYHEPAGSAVVRDKGIGTPSEPTYNSGGTSDTE